MRQVFARLLGSLKAGLATGVIIGTAAVLPVAVLAENGDGNASQDSADAIKVTVESQLKGETNKWSASNTAKPGDTLRYIISYQNLSKTNQKQVIIRDSLPPGVQLVAGTTRLYNQASPEGSKVEGDNIAGTGVAIGDYGPGANAYVTFEAELPAGSELECGDNELTNTGTVQPENMDGQKATATTTVKRECRQQASPEPAPTPAPTAPTTPPVEQPTIPAAGDTQEELPATGAGDVIGLFVGASVVGFTGYQLLLRRRLARR